MFMYTLMEPFANELWIFHNVDLCKKKNIFLKIKAHGFLPVLVLFVSVPHEYRLVGLIKL